MDKEKKVKIQSIEKGKTGIFHKDKERISGKAEIPTRIVTKVDIQIAIFQFREKATVIYPAIQNSSLELGDKLFLIVSLS